MMAFLVTAAIGILIIVLGAINMTGNISTLHAYHRSRVRPEDVLPFGKLVGLGTMIVGISCIFVGAGTFIAEKTDNGIYAVVGTAILIVGLVIGMGITFYAMKKYNGGIF